MKSMFWTSAPTGFPGARRADVRAAGAAVTGTALLGCGSARLRAPEAFTARYLGTGLPFGGQVPGGEAFGRTPVVVDIVTSEVVAPKPTQQHDATTLGIPSSSRPPG